MRRGKQKRIYTRNSLVGRGYPYPRPFVWQGRACPEGSARRIPRQNVQKGFILQDESSKLDPSFYGISQGYLIGIFQIAAGRKSPGYSGNFYAQRFYQFSKVDGRSLSFGIGIGG